MWHHPVDQMLTQWGEWVRGENRTPLGYSQVQYTEFIAKSTSASDYVGSVDPRVLELDSIIRKQLTPLSRQMITCRFAYLYNDRKSAAIAHISRSEYNKMLNRIVLPQLRLAWDLHHQPIDIHL